MWRCVVFWKTSRILMRGSVAFRPLLFSSSACGHGVLRPGAGQAHRLESPHHSERWRRAPTRVRVPPPCARLFHSRRRAPALPPRWRRLGGCQSLQSSRQLARRHHAVPHRGRAGQRRHQRAGRARSSPGMSRAQVRDVLGSPLLADPFHADRWDYVFTIRRQGAEPQRAASSCSFDGDVARRASRPAPTCRASASSSPRSTPSRPRATRRRWR